MSFSSDVTLTVLIWGFAGCCLFGCASAILKKCYDKYVMQINNDDEQEQPIANAIVSVIQEQHNENDLVQVFICENDEAIETNIIAEEVVLT